MKINIFTLGLIGVLIASPVCADEFILPQNDYVGMDTYLGQQCSSGGKILIKCGCPSPEILVTASCDRKSDVPDNGCRLLGGEGTNDNYYCVEFDGMMCQQCRCPGGTQWTSIGNNRVSMITYSLSSLMYECQSIAITEYGCAANYYTTATTPSASMTCSACPSPGESDIGNTAITGCFIPPNITFTDTSGSYKYASRCYYSK